MGRPTLLAASHREHPLDALVRGDGVQLHGAMVGSGYRTPPALVRRSDGQVFQLTPLLYAVLEAVDGRRSCADIAELVGRQLDRAVTDADVTTLVDGHLRPLGLLKRPGGSEPELVRTDPLMRLRPRVAVTNPQVTRRLIDPFLVLFKPVVAPVVTLGFVVIVAWVFFDRGLAASAYDGFDRPHLLLLVFAVSVLSGGFHEFGHAAAARYCGAHPGSMGAGLYLVWPAFYTDVTDSYRLPRGGRIRTDLGGLYFNAVVVVLTFVWWWATGWEALLLLVGTQVLQMVQQLLPLFRFDGYHLLADIAGVPDLYRRIKPTLAGLLPRGWGSPENQVLTPRARAVITLWVLVAVPMMLLMLLAFIAAVPRLLATAGAVFPEDAAAVGAAWSDGDLLGVCANALQLLGVVLPVLACAMILSRVGLRSFRGLARWGRGSAVKSAVATMLGATMVTALAWAWWPHPDNYRPIAPDERGNIISFRQLARTPSSRPGPARTAPDVSADFQSLVAAAAETPVRLLEQGPLIAAFEEGAELPTKDHPQLSLVLIPRNPAAPPTPSVTLTTGATETASTDEAWVFPFNQPLPPEEGDNQALAMVTEDDSIVYDVAFALVWADGKEVLNVNEAHAYASCSNCVAVAVAFQVVFVMEDAHVVVPQNLAVAAAYDCYRCITAAIASQLVLSVVGEPGEEELLALAEIWNRIFEFAGTITTYSVSRVMDQLESFQAEIVSILGETPVIDAGPSSTASLMPGEDGTDPSSTTTANPSSAPTSPGTAAPAPSGVSTSAAPTPSPTSPGTAVPAPSGVSTSAASTPSTSDSPTSPTSSTPSESPSTSTEPSTSSSDSTSPLTSLVTESTSASIAP